jgi:hypothetical protein
VRPTSTCASGDAVKPEIWRSLRGVVASVGTLALTLFVLVPLYLLSTNPDEFATPPDVIVCIALVCAAGATVVITLVSALLPFQFRNVIAGGFTVMAVIVYVQAYLLVGSYGQIDGSDLDMSGTWAFSVVELPLWICGIAVGVLMAERIAALRVKVLAGVLLAQAVTLAMVVSNVDWFREHPTALDESGKYKLSRAQNLLVIVLDAFQSDVFQELLLERGEIAETLDGFTFYRNYVAGYSKTAAAIPLMLTGQRYENDRPYLEFVENAFKDTSVPGRLLAAGWNVEIYPLNRNMVDLNPSTVSNVHRDIDIRTAAVEASRLFQVGVFRSSPHLVKPRVLGAKSLLGSRFEALVVSVVSGEPSSFRAVGFEHPVVQFVEQFQIESSAEQSRPAFRFYHLMVPHEPFSLDRDLRFEMMNDRGFEGYLEYSRAALEVLARILTRLKELEIYDDSAIMVVADHGGGEYQNQIATSSLRQFVGSAEFDLPVEHFLSGLPLLLVKPLGASGAMSVSDDPVDPERLSDRMLALAGITTTSGHQLGEDRRFLHYEFTNAGRYLPPMKEYRITGHSWDPNSWRSTGRIERSPTDHHLGEPFEFPRGEWIRFGEDFRQSSQLLRNGWNPVERDGVWSRGKSAFALQVPDSTAADQWLTLTGRPYLAGGQIEQQTVEVSVGDELLGSHILDSRWATFGMPVPRRLFDSDGEAIVTLEVRGAERPIDRKLRMDSRTLGFFLLAVRLDPIETIDCGRLLTNTHPFVNGLYPPESWGRWIQGTHGEIHLPLSDACQPSTLELDLVPYLNERNPVVAAEFRLNGKVIGQWSAEHGSEGVRKRVIMDIEGQVVPGWNVLEIAVSGVASPAALGLSSDSRTLGLGVTMMSLQ